MREVPLLTCTSLTQYNPHLHFQAQNSLGGVSFICLLTFYRAGLRVTDKLRLWDCPTGAPNIGPVDILSPELSIMGLALFLVGYLSASLAPTQEIPVAPPPKYCQLSPRVVKSAP